MWLQGKTEIVVISAMRNHNQVRRLVGEAIGCDITPKPYIRDIGVIIDDMVSTAGHVRRICPEAYCHIHIHIVTRIHDAL